jgi:hypothetical protein
MLYHLNEKDEKEKLIKNTYSSEISDSYVGQIEIDKTSEQNIHFIDFEY